MLKRTPSLESRLTEPSISYDRLAQSTEFINKPEVGEINEEHQHQGSISSRVYRAYLKAVGRPLSLLVIISLLFMQASKNASDLWLAHWVSSSGNSSAQDVTTTSVPVTFLPFIVHPETSPTESPKIPSYNVHERAYQLPPDSWVDLIVEQIPIVRDFDPEIKYFFTIFILIGVSNSIFTLARAFLFAYGGVQGGRKMHLKLLSIVVKVEK